MLVVLDLSRNCLVPSPGSQSPVATLAVPYGSGVQLRVLAVRNGVREDLPTGFEMTWTVKARGDYGGNELAFADTFTQDSATGHYVAAVEYSTVDLEALLDFGESPEAGSVETHAQLAWRASGSGEWQPTQNVLLTVHNSVWRDGAGGGVVESSRSFRYYPSITGLTGGGVTKLDGITTLTLPVRSLALIVREDGGSLIREEWMLLAGTDAEDAPGGIVRPDDYATTTNEKVWKQIA